MSILSFQWTCPMLHVLPMLVVRHASTRITTLTPVRSVFSHVSVVRSFHRYLVDKVSGVHSTHPYCLVQCSIED